MYLKNYTLENIACVQINIDRYAEEEKHQMYVEGTCPEEFDIRFYIL